MRYLKLTRVDPQSGVSFIAYIEENTLQLKQWGEEELKKVIEHFKTEFLNPPGGEYYISALAQRETKKGDEVTLEIIHMNDLAVAREKMHKGHTIPIARLLSFDKGSRVPPITVEICEYDNLFDGVLKARQEKEKRPTGVEQKKEARPVKARRAEVSKEEHRKQIQAMIKEIEEEPEEEASVVAERRQKADKSLKEQALRLEHVRQRYSMRNVEDELQQEAKAFLLPDDLQYSGVDRVAEVFLDHTVALLRKEAAPRALPFYALGPGMEAPQSHSQKLKWKMAIEKTLRSAVDSIDHAKEQFEIEVKKEQKSVQRAPVIEGEFNKILDEVIASYDATLPRRLSEHDKNNLANRVRDAILGKDRLEYRRTGNDLKNCQLQDGEGFDPAFVRAFNQDYPLKARQMLEKRVEQRVQANAQKLKDSIRKQVDLFKSQPPLLEICKEMHDHTRRLEEYDEEVVRLNAAAQEENANIIGYLNTLAKVEAEVFDFTKESLVDGEAVSQRLSSSPDSLTGLSEAKIYEDLRSFSHAHAALQRERLQAEFKDAFKDFYRGCQYARGSDWGKLLSQDARLQKVKNKMYAYRQQLERIRQRQREQETISVWAEELERQQQAMAGNIQRVEEEAKSTMVDALLPGRREYLQRKIEEQMVNLRAAPGKIRRTSDVDEARKLFGEAQKGIKEIESALDSLKIYSKSTALYQQLRGLYEKVGVSAPEFDLNRQADLDVLEREIKEFEKILEGYGKISEFYTQKGEQVPAFAEIQQTAAEKLNASLRKYERIAKHNDPGLPLPTFAQIRDAGEHWLDKRMEKHQELANFYREEKCNPLSLRDVIQFTDQELKDLDEKREAYQALSCLCQQTRSKRTPWEEFLRLPVKERHVLMLQLRLLQELQAVLNDVGFWSRQVAQYFKRPEDMIQGVQNGRMLKRYVPTGVAEMHRIASNAGLSAKEKLERIKRIANDRLKIERPGFPSFLSGNEAKRAPEEKRKATYKRPLLRAEATQTFYELINRDDGNEGAGLAKTSGDYFRFSKEFLKAEEKPKKLSKSGLFGGASVETDEKAPLSRKAPSPANKHSGKGSSSR